MAVNCYRFFPSFWKGANAQSEYQHVFSHIPEEGKGIMPWLFFCTTQQHPLTHNVTINLFFFAIQRWNVANPQYLKIDLLLSFFAIPEGGRGKMTWLIVFIFSPAPQHQHIPSNATINLLFVFFAIQKGERKQVINLLFLFSILEGGNGKMP